MLFISTKNAFCEVKNLWRCRIFVVIDYIHSHIPSTSVNWYRNYSHGDHMSLEYLLILMVLEEWGITTGVFFPFVKLSCFTQLAIKAAAGIHAFPDSDYLWGERTFLASTRPVTAWCMCVMCMLHYWRDGSGITIIQSHPHKMQ